MVQAPMAECMNSVPQEIHDCCKENHTNHADASVSGNEHSQNDHCGSDLGCGFTGVTLVSAELAHLQVLVGKVLRISESQYRLQNTYPSLFRPPIAV